VQGAKHLAEYAISANGFKAHPTQVRPGLMARNDPEATGFSDSHASHGPVGFFYPWKGYPWKGEPALGMQGDSSERVFLGLY
jgi:hypothetical protein